MSTGSGDVEAQQGLELAWAELTVLAKRCVGRRVVYSRERFL